MEARVIFEDTSNDATTVEINGHNLQLGGAVGDGYCYEHQSFDCADKLTEEEWKAIASAPSPSQEEHGHKKSDNRENR